MAVPNPPSSAGRCWSALHTRASRSVGWAPQGLSPSTGTTYTASKSMQEVLHSLTSHSCVHNGQAKEEGPLQIQTNVLDKDLKTSPSLELGDEDDPVEMMVQLQRMRKAREHSSRGLVTSTKGDNSGMEGTMIVAKDSHHSTHDSATKGVNSIINVAKGSHKGAPTTPKGTDAAVRGALGKTMTAMRGQTVKDPSIYDEEAATENKSLLPDDSEENDVPLRKVTALWTRLRERQDSITFDTASSLHSIESMEQRKSLYEQKMKEEIRSGLEFSVTHCILAIVVYMAVAVLAYSLVFENWPIVDSIYFATVTFTTIGYGDLAPTSDVSRLFTAFFALTGITCLGIALGVLGSNLIEAQTKAMDRDRELNKHQVMSIFDSPQQVLEEEEEAKQPPWYKSALVRDALPMFAVLLLFCFLVSFQSDWDAASTFYYFVITAATVGFGDLAPQTQSERLLAVPFILLAVGVMGHWLGVAAKAIIDRRQQEFRKRFKSRDLTLNDLLVMDDNGDGKVTLAEYLAFMLVAMNKVDQELMNDLTAQFNRLDVDGTGCLEKEDLIIVAKRKLRTSSRKLQLGKYKQELLEKSGSVHERKASAFMSAI